MVLKFAGTNPDSLSRDAMSIHGGSVSGFRLRPTPMPTNINEISKAIIGAAISALTHARARPGFLDGWLRSAAALACQAQFFHP